ELLLRVKDNLCVREPSRLNIRLTSSENLCIRDTLCRDQAVSQDDPMRCRAHHLVVRRCDVSLSRKLATEVVQGNVVSSTAGMAIDVLEEGAPGETVEKLRSSTDTDNRHVGVTLPNRCNKTHL